MNTTEQHDNKRSVAPTVAGIVGILFAGAIFGFFYAWVCSTMWGLDTADPRVAIEAMQEMNASVRNWAFAPAFFGTPFVLLAIALYAYRRGARRAARWYALAAVLYGLGAMVLTMTINVPMNEELAATAVPTGIDQARAIWDDYSGTWQRWNITRTVFSGLALVAAALGLVADTKHQVAQTASRDQVAETK